MGKKKMRGRPKKAHEELRESKLVIRLTVAEREELDAAVGRGLSTWARAELLKSARRGKKPCPDKT